MNSFAEKQKILKEQAAQEAIYAATLEVISRRPGDSLKMQDIAETAGIATGTLYNYFKNKVELLTFVDEKLHTNILSRIESIPDLPISPAEKLKSVIREIFAFFTKHHIVFDLTEKFGTKTRIPKSIKYERLKQGQNCIAAVLREGIRQQRFKNIDPDKAAKYFLSAIIGVIDIQDWLQNYQLTKEADELADFLLSNLTIRQG
jgi:AcrR family transcriptional regulator